MVAGGLVAAVLLTALVLQLTGSDGTAADPAATGASASDPAPGPGSTSADASPSGPVGPGPADSTPSPTVPVT